jgi:hypothetical protein
MEKLPIEINYKISEYFYKCDKNTNFIFNKFSLEVFKLRQKNRENKCDRIFLLHKHLCNSCDKDKIWKCRMILNNMLPG